jgi:uncharacterized phage protein gp47/JayE
MFVTRNSSDIYNDIGNKLVNETIFSKAKSPGSKARSMLALISDELGEVYSSLDIGMAMTLISTASGVFLDYMGELFNLRRQRGSGAHILSSDKIFKIYTLNNEVFGSINNGNDIIISEGSKIQSISTDNPVIFEIDDTYTCNKDSTEIWVGARSVGIGSKYNVGAGVVRTINFFDYTSANYDYLQVTNMSAITTASDIESDDNFKFRIIKQATSGEKANETAIRLALLSLPGVSDVYFIDYGFGIGTFVVYVKPVVLSAGNDLLNQCAIQIKAVKAEGIVPIISFLKRLGIEMELSITFTSDTSNLDKTLILSKIRLNVMDYLANMDKAQPFIVNEVVQRVMQTDNRILNVGQANKPIDKLWVWKDNSLNDSRYRQTLRGDLFLYYDEIVTYEYTIDTPIRVIEKV